MGMWLKRCHYCPDHVGFITIEDKYAKQLSDGSWKCGECVITDLRRTMVEVLGPNNPKVREFVQEEQKKVGHWNRFAQDLNHVSG